jgi:hypothetical protein
MSLFQDKDSVSLEYDVTGNLSSKMVIKPGRKIYDVIYYDLSGKEISCFNGSVLLMQDKDSTNLFLRLKDKLLNGYDYSLVSDVDEHTGWRIVSFTIDRNQKIENIRVIYGRNDSQSNELERTVTLIDKNLICRMSSLFKEFVFQEDYILVRIPIKFPLRFRPR